uniref:rhamnan synthesis F family protein n=1 Tax=Yoonia sp. TaxID=2212373 RepID=UPI003F6AFC09
MTIPLWKLNRELRRIGNQILRSPYIILDIHERLMEPVWRHRHRKAFDAHAAVGDGQVAETQRVAIFLIYQPGGVAQSTISLCENMIALGFSPFIVSNAPLSQTDRSRINAVAWKVMERPNFGYDFGGYQDALFALRDLKDTLEYLIIMNDSVWLEFTPDLWERLLAQDSDVVGFIQEDKIIDISNRDIATENQNLQSYFFIFKGILWKADAFWHFWKNYKMVSNKKRTIKNGEIEFTNHLVKCEISATALISKKRFIEKIEASDNSFIRTALNYAVYNSNRLRKENLDLLERFDSSKSW